MSRMYDETGYSEPVPGDSLCDSMMESVRGLVEYSSGQSFSALKCMSYSYKRRYGTNYRVKASNGQEIFHFSLYVPPNSSVPQLNGLERLHRQSDALNVPIDDRAVRFSWWDKRSTTWDTKPAFSSD